MNVLHQQYQEIQNTLKSKLNWNTNQSYSECIGEFVFGCIPIRQKFIEHPNFIVCYGEWDIAKECTVAIKNAKKTFKIQFELEGYSCFTSKNSTIEIPEDCFNFIFVKNPDGQLHYKKNRKVLEIVFDEKYFMREVLKKFPYFEEFKVEIITNIEVTLFKKAKTISSELHKILVEILHNKVHPSLKMQYLQHKIDEVLLLLVDMSLPTLDVKLDKNDNLTDQDRILRIKNWIENNYLKDIHLETICTIFHITENKLRTSFKKYYGMTVMKYIKEKRFEYAYTLLKSGKYSVNEISELMFYEYPQHFSIAFKKMYGKSPSDLHKSKQ